MISQFRRLWIRCAIVWAALILLLALAIAIAELGILGGGLALRLAIAGVQIGLVWILYMHLGRASAPVRLASIAGFLWLSFLFTITFADYLTRPWNGGGTSLVTQAAPTPRPPGPGPGEPVAGAKPLVERR